MIKTRSAGGIILRENLILIASQHGTSWSLPKGHLEGEEREIDAAKREIYEETGITELQLIKKLGSYQRYKIDKFGKENKEELKTITMFLFETNQKIINPKDKENPEAKWVTKEEVLDYLSHPQDKKFYLSVKNKI